MAEIVEFRAVSTTRCGRITSDRLAPSILHVPIRPIEKGSKTTCKRESIDSSQAADDIDTQPVINEC